MLGFGETRRVGLIKELAEQRLRLQNMDDFEARVLIKSLGTIKCMGLPEGTIVTVVEAVLQGRRRGVPLRAVLERQEQLRRMQGSNPFEFRAILKNINEEKVTPSVVAYIKYRLDIGARKGEHPMLSSYELWQLVVPAFQEVARWGQDIDLPVPTAKPPAVESQVRAELLSEAATSPEPHSVQEVGEEGQPAEAAPDRPAVEPPKPVELAFTSAAVFLCAVSWSIKAGFDVASGDGNRIASTLLALPIGLGILTLVIWFLEVLIRNAWGRRRTLSWINASAFMWFIGLFVVSFMGGTVMRSDTQDAPAIAAVAEAPADAVVEQAPALQPEPLQLPMSEADTSDLEGADGAGEVQTQADADRAVRAFGDQFRRGMRTGWVQPATAQLRNFEGREYLALEQMREVGSARVLLNCLQGRLHIMAGVVTNENEARTQAEASNKSYLEIDGEAVLVKGQGGALAEGHTVWVQRYMDPASVNLLRSGSSLEIWLENSSPLRWGGQIDLVPVRAAIDAYVARCQ